MLSWYSSRQKASASLAPAGLEVVRELPDVAAGAEGLLARALHDDPRDRRILRPGIESAAHLADHGQGQSVERLRTVERDEARLALLLAENFNALVHETLLHLDAA